MFRKFIVLIFIFIVPGLIYADNTLPYGNAYGGSSGSSTNPTTNNGSVNTFPMNGSSSTTDTTPPQINGSSGVDTAPQNPSSNNRLPSYATLIKASADMRCNH